jgi:hypothetical protein|tara:strand:+ start:307 stop:1119 length:813 start_codon:yes stop_codon:yes gene_type:complete
MNYLKIILKTIWGLITPASLRHRISRVRWAWNLENKMILRPTFADDGLISQHISDFLTNERFNNAYREGVNQGGLENHPGGIEFRAYVCCWAATYAAKLEGDFVECGVGHGLLSKTVANYLNFNSIDKQFYLFDTFEGIPLSDASSVKEEKNMRFLNESHFDDNYFQKISDSFENYKGIKIIKGYVPDVLNTQPLEKVSYLSIDMNNAKAEIGAIKYLWGKLTKGAVVVLDDYAYGEEFRDQKDAWDDFSRENNFTILSLPTGQGLIIKT